MFLELVVLEIHADLYHGLKGLITCIVFLSEPLHDKLQNLPGRV